MRITSPRILLRRAALVGAGVFAATVVFSFFAETITSKLAGIYPAFIFLLLIIIISVIFDIIGTAATAADEAPFHAKAAKKVHGARQSVYLVRNADRVANFTQDVVGDIAGIVAGALGISLIVQVVALIAVEGVFWPNIIITAMIAALTVGGKAYGKGVAVSRANDIIFAAGRILAVIERTTGCGPAGNSDQRRPGKRRR